MDIRNYITKRKRDEDSESQTESDNLSASANEYLLIRKFRKFLQNLITNLNVFCVKKFSLLIIVSKDITIEIITS